jgi:hypothetical protein
VWSAKNKIPHKCLMHIYLKMVDTSLHLTREMALLIINGKEIVVKSRLPKIISLRSCHFIAQMLRFVFRIHKKLPAGKNFDQVTGDDDFILNRYLFYSQNMHTL